MPDLDERIRAYVDTAQPRVTLREIKECLNENQPMGRSRSNSRRKWLLGVSAVVAGVAALMVAFLTVPNAGPGKSSPASAATILRHTAMVADSQRPLVPGPGQFLYVRLLDGSRELGTSFQSLGHGMPCPGTTFRKPSNNGLRRPARTARHPRSSTNLSSSTTPTGNCGRKPDPLSLTPGYSGGGAPPYYDVTDLPTDPSKMSAFFASQADLVQTANGQPNALWDFSTAASFLQRGACSEQRAALLEYMATIRGVTDAGSGTTLGTKQTGTILAMPSTAPGYAVQVIIDQATSQVLEQRLVVSDPGSLPAPTAAQIASGRGIAPIQMGQAEQYTDFLYVGIAGSSSAIPNGAPPSPAPWLFGSGREPLPGSAY